MAEATGVSVCLAGVAWPPPNCPGCCHHLGLSVACGRELSVSQVALNHDLTNLGLNNLYNLGILRKSGVIHKRRMLVSSGHHLGILDCWT